MSGCAHQPGAPPTQKKIYSTTCRIPLRPFDYLVKAGQPARREVFPGRYATRRIRKLHLDFWPPLFDA
jgi:hypothetical protein